MKIAVQHKATLKQEELAVLAFSCKFATYSSIRRQAGSKAVRRSLSGEQASQLARVSSHLETDLTLGSYYGPKCI